METIEIDIVSPKAMSIIKNLAALKLINIRELRKPKKSFQNLLDKLRSGKQKLSLEEITQEVNMVRAKRYGQKK